MAKKGVGALEEMSIAEILEAQSDKFLSKLDGSVERAVKKAMGGIEEKIDGHSEDIKKLQNEMSELRQQVQAKPKWGSSNASTASSAGRPPASGAALGQGWKT